MRRSRRIAVSTALTAGALGVAGVAAAAVPHGTSLTPGASAPVRDEAGVDHGALEEQLRHLDAQTRALDREPRPQ